MMKAISSAANTKPSSWRIVLFALLLAVFSVGCSSTRSHSPAHNLPSQPSASGEVGVASYYADQYHGRKTASGEIFDMYKLTAAHRKYPFGTNVRVTHLGNNLWVVVRINDRGPFVRGRILDLSLAAARQLQMIQSGGAQVKVEVVETRQASSK